MSPSTASIPCQRWSPGGIPSWRRPEDGGFNRARYGVKEIGEDEARDFVLGIHYSKAWVATLRRYGMFDLRAEEGPRLVGAAILSSPVNVKVLTNPFPRLVPYTETAEAGRFCLLDEVPANAETWLMGETRRLAAEAGFRGLVLFSDPVPRWCEEEEDDDDGAPGARRRRRLVKPGHFGIAYQAAGNIFTGTSTPGVEYHFPDGFVFNRRTAQKIRKQESGHEYAEKQLRRWGARPMRAGEKPAAWLREVLPALVARKVARKVVHPGKLRYLDALGLTPAARRANRREIDLPALPYPKPYLGQLVLFED